MSDTLPPIAVFWDIENCAVPKWKSALCVVQSIRAKFFTNHREVEFMCVCDTTKENRDVIQELNSAQVNVVHINATSKNAADDKLHQCLRRFSDTYQPPATIILISSDVNFAGDLSDLRYRKKYNVVLIHGRHVAEALKVCANECCLFDDLVKGIPQRKAVATEDGGTELEVSGFCPFQSPKKIHSRLKKLSANCGGRVVSVGNDVAVIRFACHNDASKARKRMEGEDVYGKKVKVNFPQTSPGTTTDIVKDDHNFKKKQIKHMKSESVSPSVTVPVKGANGNSGKQQDEKDKSSNRGTYPSEEKQQKSLVQSHLQGVVDKFSKYKKGSRQVLMLQQQLYQEGQKQASTEGDNTNAVSTYSKNHYYNEAYRYQHSYNMQMNSSYGYHDYNVANSFYHYGSQHNRSFTSYSSYRSLFEGSHLNYRNMRYSPSYYNSSNSESVNYPCSSQQQWNNRSSPYTVPSTTSSSQYRSNARSDSPLNSNQIFRPISSPSPCPSSEDSSSCDNIDQNDWDMMTGPVELLISNLDYNISPKEWRKILFTTFHPHVRVLNVHVKTQSDNTSLGMVKVQSIEEARFAISQFHRKKIGYKRIHVTLKAEDPQRPASSTRMEAIALLSEAKDNVLPLFKFIELFDKRYHRSISVSELYKMRDTIEIREQGGAGRMVYLASALQQPSPEQESIESDSQEILEQPACQRHCPEGSAPYAEAVNSNMLPNVKMRLKSFSAQVHTLLQTHEGNMPLMSFPACYGAEFSPIMVSVEGGVPLEHLISCVPGIQIQVSTSGIKKIQWAENRPPLPSETNRLSASPLLNQQLNQISREMIDLLKQSPHCRMPFSKFIPTYHHFFGRQCRVADYGYNRLKDLFEAIPHVVQVLGTGDRKILTLSHRAQVKRFTTDLLKILKAQAGKKISVGLLPETFAIMYKKRLDVTEYGMAYLDDLLAEVPTSSAVLFSEGGENLLALPRKDQSPDEIERTKQFALEVVDLLKHNPQCRMPFNKFIPAYHHHFGRQCRVSDYGFSKLLDLFEAIPHVVELEDEGEERLIHLTEPELRKILAEQMVNLLRCQKNQCIPLHHLMSAFTCHYGFNIPLQDFSVDSEEELLSKLKHVVKVEMVNRCKYVKLTERRETPELAHQILKLLMDESGGSLPLMEVCSRYKSSYGVECDIKKIKEELLDYVQVTGDDESGIISLTALQTLARDVRIMLHKHTHVLISQFEKLYKDNFGVEIKPALYGCPTLTALLETIPHVVSLRGKGHHKYIQLSTDLPGSPTLQNVQSMVKFSPQTLDSDTQSSDSGVTDTLPEEEEMIKHNVYTIKSQDLLSGKVPSTIPSPLLHPEAHQEDLIKFEMVTDLAERILSLSEEEKIGQKTPLCRTPTSDLLQLAAQCLISRPPSTEPGPEKIVAQCNSSAELLELIKGEGWWKMNQKEQEEFHKNFSDVAVRSLNEKDAKVTDTVSKTTSIPEDTVASSQNNTEVSDNSLPEKEVDKTTASQYKSSLTQNSAVDQVIKELRIPAKLTEEKILDHPCNVSEDMSYENFFRQEMPLETSSTKSDTSTLSDRSQESPKKSPRKTRLAAKFSIPMDLGNQLKECV